MRHEGEILFATLLHFKGLLGRKGLQGHPDRAVQDPVHDPERLALQNDPMGLSKIVDAAAKDVVLGHDLLDIKAVFHALQTVRRWAPFA